MAIVIQNCQFSNTGIVFHATCINTITGRHSYTTCLDLVTAIDSLYTLNIARTSKRPVVCTSFFVNACYLHSQLALLHSSFHILWWDAHSFLPSSCQHMESTNKKKQPILSWRTSNCRSVYFHPCHPYRLSQWSQKICKGWRRLEECWSRTEREQDSER